MSVIKKILFVLFSFCFMGLLSPFWLMGFIGGCSYGFIVVGIDNAGDCMRWLHEYAIGMREDE